MKKMKGWIFTFVLIGFFIVLISNMELWRFFLEKLFPELQNVIYPRASLIKLVAEHLFLVSLSSVLSIIIGVGLGILVTRKFGQQFADLVNNLATLGQTFPPVAVLMLAVPMLGFGAEPTIFALFLYGLLPILRNTISGLEGVSQQLLQAATGMGMNGMQCLVRIELPLAMRVIIAGIRISVVINVGTAAVGATIGAGGLGSPIVSGLVNQNTAFILEGAIPAALLAFILDRIFGQIERSFYKRQ
ncbi:MAG: ABC transporter permease [Kosmotoga sp.]|nr:MAG: ABC transporter permease [Kosmotoga sp.]